MKLIAKTIPKSDGSTVVDIYMTFREKRQLMSTWLATFRHEADAQEWIALQAK